MRCAVPIAIALVAGLSFLAGCATPTATAAAGGIDPQADRCLREMSETLAAARQFTFRYRVASELLLVEGRPVAAATERRVAVRRPDGLAITLMSSAGRRQLWFDGQRFVSLDLARNAYAQFDVRPNIEELCVTLTRDYQVDTPFVRLILFADPYAAIRPRLEGARYLGIESLGGQKCHHLALAEPTRTWELWVAIRPAAVPRRLTARFLDDPQRPPLEAEFDDWNLNARLADDLFEPRVPAGAYEVELVDLAGVP